jgi:hypothetical protein
MGMAPKAVTKSSGTLPGSERMRHGLRIGQVGLFITVVGVCVLSWTPWVMVVGWPIALVGYVSASWHR